MWSRVFCSLSLLLLIRGSHSCDQLIVSDESEPEPECTDETCKVQFNKSIQLLPNTEICLVQRSDNQTDIMGIKILMDQPFSVCKMKSMYFVSDYEARTMTRYHCPSHDGPCGLNETSCEHLAEESRCQEHFKNCSTLGRTYCNVGELQSGCPSTQGVCRLIRVNFAPVGEPAKLRKCVKWTDYAMVQIDTLDGVRLFQGSIRHGKPLTIGQLTLSADMRPNEGNQISQPAVFSISGSTRITSHFSAPGMPRKSEVGEFQCSSLSLPDSCKIAPDICDCDTHSCYCNIIDLMANTIALPTRTPRGLFSLEDGQLKVHDAVGIQGTLHISGHVTFRLRGHNATCEFGQPQLSGCRGCPDGAQLTVPCKSDSDPTVKIKCQSKVSYSQCNTTISAFVTADKDEMICHVTCGLNTTELKASGKLLKLDKVHRTNVYKRLNVEDSDMMDNNLEDDDIKGWVYSHWEFIEVMIAIISTIIILTFCFAVLIYSSPGDSEKCAHHKNQKDANAEQPAEQPTAAIEAPAQPS